MTAKKTARKRKTATPKAPSGVNVPKSAFKTITKNIAAINKALGSLKA